MEVYDAVCSHDMAEEVFFCAVVIGVVSSGSFSIMNLILGAFSSSDSQPFVTASLTIFD